MNRKIIDRHLHLKANYCRIVNGKRVVRAIPWEVGIRQLKCPLCGYIYKDEVDWKAENWEEKDQYKQTILDWGNGEPYKVKCLKCSGWIVFDPVRKVLRTRNLSEV